MKSAIISPSAALWKQLKVLPLVFGLMTVTLASPALSQEKLTRTLTVTGRGTENIPATLALVRLGVEIQGKTAQEVQEEVARRSEAVVALLRSRNVDKLETAGIRLNPVYSYTNNVQKLTGYQASNIVSFQITTDRAGTLLDEAVKAGATRIDSVSFVATEAAIATAQQQALREATAEAQKQADVVLDALKLTRRDIVNVQINGAYTPPPVPMFSGANVAELRAAKTPIMGGEQQIEASVTLQIGY